MQISSLGSQKQPENSNVKKYVLIALIISIILLFIVLVLIVMLQSMKPKKLTLTIDGKSTEFAEDTFMIEDNIVYVSLKDIAKLIGYRYNPGDLTTEDKKKCYLDCDDELVLFELTSDQIYKITGDDKETYSEFTIDVPVKRSNDKFYVSSSGLAIGCNLQFSYNPNTKEIKINTLPALFKTYNDKATAGEYTNVSELDDNFKNKKTILYGMLTVKNDKNKYGIISIDGSEIYLGVKYDGIEFVENSQEFFAQIDGKYGIISKDGAQKIPLYFDEIKLLDNKTNLYYVVHDAKKGVIEKSGTSGKMKIYTDYQEIGINPALFPANNIKNPMLLYDNCIPAYDGSKWGIFDTTGKLISNFNWSSLGYIETTTVSARANNLLTIDYISGIIVCNKDGKYGIINSVGNLIVPCSFDKIYLETLNGKDLYYLQSEGRTTELNAYLEEKGVTIDKPNVEEPGVIDLDVTPTPNLDLETPNIIQNKPTPTPIPIEEDSENTSTNTIPQTEPIENDVVQEIE